MKPFSINQMKTLIMYRSIIIVLFVLVGSWSTLNAQNDTDKFAKIKAEKIAFLTEKMDLKVNEAEKFWPLYNDYNKAMWAIRNEARSSIKSPNEEQAKSILFTNLDKEEKEIALKRSFYEKASKVVSYQKLYLFDKGEREFRLKILERYKNMRKDK